MERFGDQAVVITAKLDYVATGTMPNRLTRCRRRPGSDDRLELAAMQTLATSRWRVGGFA